MSSIRIGRFQVLGQLGTGAHSTILHVRRAADGQPYALKVVPYEGEDDLKFVEQAKHEFRVAQMLDHPNLIKIYAVETIRDWLFRVRKVHLLIEYAEGQTLDTLKRIPTLRLVQLFSRVAAAMSHMHRRGVFHADLKPNNLILSRSGQIKLIDYGLAWIKGEPKDRVQGTPEYMAPEQVKKSVVNERTDIYNFGATLYRMVTWRSPPNTLAAAGDLPLNSETWNQLLKPVQQLNPQAPADLCDLIHRCMAYHPQSRPERMSEVQEALDWVAAKLSRAGEQGG